MIVIEMSIQKIYFSMSIVGHAEYNPGNDIVYAAVSTITQTFLCLYSEMGYEDNIKSESGLVEVKGKLNDDIIPFLKFIYTGYLGLANAYPDNVSLKTINKEKLLI